MATVIPGRWSGPDRPDLLAGLSAERMADALAFLAGYAPAVFDAVLAATEPGLGGTAAGGDGLDDALEPYCTRCGARAGVFPALGDDWRHYTGTPQARTVRTHEADHAPVVGWRPSRDGPSAVAR